MILASALLCLSLNLYHEARGEPILGQYAVAAVTMTRAGNDPARVCEVVLKPHQFSWTTSKIARSRDGWRLKSAGVPKDEDAWVTATKIAYQTLNGHEIDLTRGATFYHETKAKPLWRRKFERVVAIGNHIFYRRA